MTKCFPKYLLTGASEGDLRFRAILAIEHRRKHIALVLKTAMMIAGVLKIYGGVAECIL